MRKVPTAVAVIAIAGAAVTACSSTPKPVTGTETLQGTATGATVIANSTQYHLTLSGPVATTSTWSTPPGNNEKITTTFKTSKGNLVLAADVKGFNNTPPVNPKTCLTHFTVSGTYTVDGSKSTGKFKNATGHGTVNNTATVTLPKLKSGACDESQNAEPMTAGAKAVIVIKGPLTVK